MSVVALLVALQLFSLLQLYAVPLSIFLKRSQESQKHAKKRNQKQTELKNCFSSQENFMFLRFTFVTDVFQLL